MIYQTLCHNCDLCHSAVCFHKFFILVLNHIPCFLTCLVIFYYVMHIAYTILFITQILLPCLDLLQNYFISTSTPFFWFYFSCFLELQCPSWTLSSTQNLSSSHRLPLSIICKIYRQRIIHNINCLTFHGIIKKIPMKISDPLSVQLPPSCLPESQISSQ